MKIREINDLHHANDAYLNIVVGNVFDTKFTSNPIVFIQKTKQYNLEKLYDFNVEGAWETGELGSIKKVKNNMNENNVLSQDTPYEQKGQFFDQQILKAGKGQFPIKIMIKSSVIQINTVDIIKLRERILC